MLLKNTISINTNNQDYILYEKDNDNEVFNLLKNELKQKGLLDKEKQVAFNEKYKKYYNTFILLTNALEKVSKDIREEVIIYGL